MKTSNDNKKDYEKRVDKAYIIAMVAIALSFLSFMLSLA